MGTQTIYDDEIVITRYGGFTTDDLPPA